MAKGHFASRKLLLTAALAACTVTLFATAPVAVAADRMVIGENFTSTG